MNNFLYMQHITIKVLYYFYMLLEAQSGCLPHLLVMSAPVQKQKCNMIKSFTSHGLLLLFSSSHFLSLQIWCPIFLFRQLLQEPQFSFCIQGPHTPHLFLFFFWGTRGSISSWPSI